ncbi:MAG: hypothetical protein L0K70_04015, partial [Bifidobacterium crudilactis]|nr:hypothetical protein [Bifidobacterium crudilactis]
GMSYPLLRRTFRCSILNLPAACDDLLDLDDVLSEIVGEDEPPGEMSAEASGDDGEQPAARNAIASVHAIRCIALAFSMTDPS